MIWVPDGEDGVERGGGILGNEGDGAAPHAVVHHGGILAEEVAALEAHLAAADASRPGRQDAEDGARQRGLAAPALADQADDLAGADVEADAVEHLRHPAR